MRDPQLEPFALVGGTALTLYMGHRMSVDIDLFSLEPFHASEMEKHMVGRYGFDSLMLRNNTLMGKIHNIKIDLITLAYPRLQPYTMEEGIRLYSLEDIAAMKLSAIADTGTRLKDFVDVAFLSTGMSLNDMLAAYGKKYSNSNSVRALKGLSYHNDILFDEQINLLSGKYNWEHIRQRIADMVRFPAKIFNNWPTEKE